MDRKTKVAIILAVFFFVDNVRVGLKYNRLQKISLAEYNSRRTFEDLFLTACKYVPDENVLALKEESNFILVTHGCIPPQD